MTLPCPRCGSTTDVKDSRADASRRAVLRKRQCRECGFRFTTREDPIGGSTVVKDMLAAAFAAEDAARAIEALKVSIAQVGVSLKEVDPPS